MLKTPFTMASEQTNQSKAAESSNSAQNTTKQSNEGSNVTGSNSSDTNAASEAPASSDQEPLHGGSSSAQTLETASLEDIREMYPSHFDALTRRD